MHSLDVMTKNERQCIQKHNKWTIMLIFTINQKNGHKHCQKYRHLTIKIMNNATERILTNTGVSACGIHTVPRKHTKLQLQHFTNKCWTNIMRRCLNKWGHRCNKHWKCNNTHLLVNTFFCENNKNVSKLTKSVTQAFSSHIQVCYTNHANHSQHNLVLIMHRLTMHCRLINEF